MISDKAIIHPNVKLGNNVTVEPFAEIGKPVKMGKKLENLETIIGDDSFISSGTTIFAGVKTGKGFKTQEGVRVEECCEFGDNVALGFNTVVLCYSKFGSNIRIHALCLIPEYAEIESNVWVGPRAGFTNVPHPKCPQAKVCEKDYSIKLKEWCRVGGAVTTVPGITIGSYALVGTGAVVTKDVEPATLVVGVPARVLKHVSEITCKDSEKYKIKCPYELPDHLKKL